MRVWWVGADWGYGAVGDECELCSAIALVPGTVNLSLVLRLDPTVQVSANVLSFTYDADMSVVSYSPTSGPLSSYTVLTIVGTGFINSTLTQCRFGSVYSVVATVVSTTRLLCSIPPRFTFIAADLSLYVDILLTGNGQDYIALAPPFRFLLPTDCQPGTICPPVFSSSTAIVACPAGSFCPGTDSALLCPAGTFQMYPSQSSCLPCPPAFFCPTPGLTMPLLCPAGSLCSSTSIVNPYITPCNAGHFCLSGSVLAEPLVAHVADTVSSAIGAARKLLAVVDAAGPNTTDASDGLAAVIYHLQLYGAYSLNYNNSALYKPTRCSARIRCQHTRRQSMHEWLLLPARHRHALHHQRHGQRGTQHQPPQPDTVLSRLPLPLRLCQPYWLSSLSARLLLPDFYAGAAVSDWFVLPW